MKNYFNQETERLIFRKFTLDDVDNWIPFFMNNSGLKYLGIDISKTAVELANEWINKQLERYESEGCGLLALIEKESGQLIGSSGLIKRCINDEDLIEIAYSIKPKYWRKGFASEASGQLKKFGFKHQTAERLISIIDKRNTGSIKVALNNGMTIEQETEFLGLEVYVYSVKR